VDAAVHDDCDRAPSAGHEADQWAARRNVFGGRAMFAEKMIIIQIFFPAYQIPEAFFVGKVKFTFCNRLFCD
jgi:hypothetical protein